MNNLYSNFCQNSGWIWESSKNVLTEKMCDQLIVEQSVFILLPDYSDTSKFAWKFRYKTQPDVI